MTTRIAVIGTGYVGLVTGTCFAELGHDVVCVDIDKNKIDRLRAGDIPIYEPGLEALVSRNMQSGRLRFSVDLPAAVADREAIFIAVGTPSDQRTGHADLQYVKSAVLEVARSAKNDFVLITKSTVPVGTNHELAQIAKAHVAPGLKVHVASNPEFLREGAAISDFMEPDRVVVGVDDYESLGVMKSIYAPLVEQNVPLVITSVKTAEVTKYAANAFLAIKVSFINEMADLCEAVGADVEDVALAIGLDKRIGSAFLKAGPGWGGSCFPKDTRALHAAAKDVAVQIRILEAAISSNEARKKAMAERIINHCNGDVKNKIIAFLGVTFKGQTDDLRESPSLEIVDILEKAGARIVAFDPSMPETAKLLLPNVKMVSSAVDAAKDADALVLVTDWKLFRTLDFAKIALVMKSPKLIDLRNFLDPKAMVASGFSNYFRLGS